MTKWPRTPSELETSLMGLRGAYWWRTTLRSARDLRFFVLERDAKGDPIRVVWGIPRGLSSPAVVVTAYRPDPARWSADFLERRR